MTDIAIIQSTLIKRTRMTRVQVSKYYFVIVSVLFLLLGCSPEHKDTGGVSDQEKIDGVHFYKETLRRVGGSGETGDNWCVTWAKDGSQITSMDDGSWLDPMGSYHNRLYRISGDSDFNHNKDVSDVANYPGFLNNVGESNEPGWYGYGVVSIGETIYSMVSLTSGTKFGPFLGVKMVKSPDNGERWYRVNKQGKSKYMPPSVQDFETAPDEMFFNKEFGKEGHGRTSYPFVWLSFVQNGKAASASPDGYIYIYSPEGSDSSQLLLARVQEDKFERRSNWEFFKSWNGSTPVWTNDISQRGAVLKYPDKSKNHYYFGWYSWLPSVVWNEGLGVYIMVNGGTYAGTGMTQSKSDYYNSWVHVESGSLGFWYSKNPYGPWEKFYYTDHFIVDNKNNRTYQPKLSPKWISEDGKRMTLIWSDAGKNDKGKYYSENYTWNQMEIEIKSDLWEK